MTTEQSPDTRPNRRRLLLIVGAALLVVVAGVGIAIAAIRAQETPVATPTPTAASPTPTPTPTPTPAALPRSAVAKGSIAGWQLAAETDIAGVHPQAGGAADGEVSLWIDAPVVRAPLPVATATAATQTATEYTVTASVRLLAEYPEAVPVTLTVGAQTYELPELDAEWTTVEFDYLSGIDETSAAVSVVVGAPVRGFSIDRISVVPTAGGDDIVPNGSFEDVAVDWGIRNDSLILVQDTATLAVALAPGTATWTATDAAGTVIAQGAEDVRAGLDAIPLTGLAQSYTTLSVTDAGGRSVSTPIAVVDVDGGIMPTDGRLGAHINPLAEYSVDAAAQAQALGLGALRGNITWEYVEKPRGVYNFGEKYPAAFNKGAAHGMAMLAVAGWTSKHYDGGRTPSSAEAVAAYGRYVAALTQNFPLAGVEVYNEFNIATFNKGPCGLTADCYLPLLQSAYAEVEAVSPDVPVVGGVTGNYPPEWFDRLWTLGGLGSVDAVSYHPYQVYASPESLADIVAQSQQSMQNIGGGQRPVWITELGWTSKTGDITQAQQASLLQRTEIVALAAGVERFFWYDLVNDSRDPAHHEGNFGLFAQPVSGVASLPPKPSAFAQALLVAQLDGRALSAHDQTGTSAWSVGFGDDDDPVRAVWTASGTTERVAYEAEGPVTVTTSLGAVTVVEPVDGVVEVEVTDTVTFVDGAGAVATAG